MSFSFKGQFDNCAPVGATLTEEGYFKVKVKEIQERETKKGASRAIFRCTVVGGPHQGFPVVYGLNIPVPGESDYLWGWWMSLLISLGVPAAKLRKNPTINSDKLVGKAGYVHYSPPPPGGTYPEIKWLTKEQYDFHRKIEASQEPKAEKEESQEPVADLPEKTGDPLEYLEL